MRLNEKHRGLSTLLTKSEAHIQEFRLSPFSTNLKSKKLFVVFPKKKYEISISTVTICLDHQFG